MHLHVLHETDPLPQNPVQPLESRPLVQQAGQEEGPPVKGGLQLLHDAQCLHNDVGQLLDQGAQVLHRRAGGGEVHVFDR